MGVAETNGKNLLEVGRSGKRRNGIVVELKSRLGKAGAESNSLAILNRIYSAMLCSIGGQQVGARAEVTN